MGKKMYLPFYKYQGTGNDFILIDYRKNVPYNLSQTDIQQLCHRQQGIGADGLMYLQNHQKYDFEMVYYNRDGSQSLCGNGSRCAVHFAHHIGIIGQTTNFVTTDGLHKAAIQGNMVHLGMYDVAGLQTIDNDFLVDTGSPHYIKFVNDIAQVDVAKEGRAIRYNPMFQKAGVNVSFVKVNQNNTLFVSTYERGVEAETLSCGTGVTAAALVASSKGLKSPITVSTQGGTLQVSFLQKGKNTFTNITLIGPAVKVFEGKIEI